MAVKTVKRLLRSNTGPSGTLNSDKFLRAILQLRNTPDATCHLSPAQVVFGRPLRDSFSFLNRLEKFSNRHIHPIWREAWKEKESALRTRYHKTAEALSSHCRPLSPLHIGDRCYVQNQTGPHPNRWDRSGTVIETPGYDSYIVKVDGSGRITRRNRKFLRKFTPVETTVSECPPPPISNPLVETTTSPPSPPSPPDLPRRSSRQTHPPPSYDADSGRWI